MTRERPTDGQRPPRERPKMGHRAPIGIVTIEFRQWPNVLTHRLLIERPQCLKDRPGAPHGQPASAH